jgi:hypothetical protein
MLQLDLNRGWTRWPCCDPALTDGEMTGLGAGITGLVAIEVFVHLKPIDVIVSTAQCMYILPVRTM